MLSFNVAAASALIPSVAHTFSVDEFFAGRVVWLYMLSYGLSALLYGPLARSINCKKILFFSVGVLALANALAGLAPNIQLLFAGRILSGISGAAIIPISLILIAKTSDFGERGRKVGIFFSIIFASSLLGLFLSGVIFWRWIFFLPAIAALLLWLAIYFYFPQLSFTKEKISFNYLQVLSDRVVWRLFVYIFAISFLHHGIRQWLGVYFSTTYAFGQFLISMLLTTISFSGIFGEAFGGILAGRIGRLKAANLGVGLMLVAVGLLLFKNVLFFLFVIMFIWGLGWTFNHAGISTNLTDLPQKYLYESASLNSSIRFLSGGLGAVFGGILAHRSFNLEFTIFGIYLFLLLIFSRRLLDRRNHA